MRHYPIFLDTKARRIVVSGAGEEAAAKLRLIVRTEASISVFGTEPCETVRAMADAGRIALFERALAAGDADGAALLYCANDDEDEDRRVAAIGRQAGALVNVVDDLDHSQFITPALVDRDPVTIAIGTEGAAPVLARAIKADLEARLPSSLGLLARLAQAFRPRAALVPQGPQRRALWTRYWSGAGERALATGGEAAVERLLETLLTDTIERRPADGRVSFVSAGPGDPDLMTMKARRVLHEADVVLHDRLVPAAILELARREALIVETGKKGHGPAMGQDAINALMAEHAKAGAHVVRLKGGDASVFGRLDEEIAALQADGIAFEIVPGVTSASAAAAAAGQSLTRRGRNTALTFLTAHDMDGFAEHDWRALARPGATAAIYMARKGAASLAARLIDHGADSGTPVTIVANASRPDQQVVEGRLATLAATLARLDAQAPAILLYGIGTKAPAAAATRLRQEVAA